MYSIKLVNYSFDDTYSNIRLFDDKVSRETFFDNLQGTTQNVENFNAGNLLQTQVVFDANVSIPLTKLLNFNYCIVKLLDENGGISSENESLYFHIKRCQQGSQQRIIIDLEIDPFMTYWYDIEFSDCLITRAHLDRFIKNTNGTYSFDGRAISNLFEREDIKDVPKRLVERKKLKYYTNNTSQKAMFEMFDKIDAWVYVYLNDDAVQTMNSEGALESYKLKKSKINAGDYDEIELPTAILCFPLSSVLDDTYLYVEKTTNNIIYDTIISSKAWIDFVENNPNIYGQIYSIKLSVKPPIDLSKIDEYNSTFNEGVLFFEPDSAVSVVQYLKNSTTGVGVLRTKRTIDSSNLKVFNGLFYIINDYKNPILFETGLNLPQMTFSKTEIIGATRNSKFNPKINSMDYKTLTITFAGSRHEFPIDKMATENPKFEYFECLTSDTTRGLLRFKSENDSNVFNFDYSKSFNGFSFANDLSIAFSQTAYDNFIANNKNAYLSFQNQQTYNLASATFRNSSRLAGSVAQMTPSSLISGIISTGEDLLQTSLKNAYEEAQFNLSIDNMKSAPDTLSGLNGNAILTHIIAEFGIYAELYSGLDAELNIANDFQFENGYYFNQYGNIKDFCCTRKYFNYIQAVPDNIVGNLSNELKQHIKNILSRGVRFWHVGEISYSLENYEQLLEEEA